MYVTDCNTKRERINNFTLTVSTGVFIPHATCYVHRGRDYCKPHNVTSKASVDRVMRAQKHILAQGETK